MTLLPKPVSGSKAPPKAYASLLLDNDEDPLFWTSYFNVQPDIFVTKGELFRLPSGRMSSAPGRANVWGCTSKSAISGDTLDPHISYLIALLALPRTELPELLSKRKTSMRLLCYWLRRYEADAPSIDADLEEIIKHCGGIVEIDEYLGYDTKAS